MIIISSLSLIAFVLVFFAGYLYGRNTRKTENSPYIGYRKFSNKRFKHWSDDDENITF